MELADKAWPSRLVFIALLAAAGLAILVSARSMAPQVASHFDAAGVANGFVTRGSYLALLLAVAIGFPLVLSLVQAAMTSRATTLRIPDAAYWLAPARRDATIAAINAQMMRFGLLLCAFMLYTHRLVMRANTMTPPRLESTSFVAGLVVFLMLVGIWMFGFFRRFRRAG